jgi:hypothetical protein
VSVCSRPDLYTHAVPAPACVSRGPSVNFRHEQPIRYALLKRRSEFDQKGRRRLCSARRYWRKAHSRTPYPSANPTIRLIAISSTIRSAWTAVVARYENPARFPLGGLGNSQRNSQGSLRAPPAFYSRRQLLAKAAIAASRVSA